MYVVYLDSTLFINLCVFVHLCMCCVCVCVVLSSTASNFGSNQVQVCVCLILTSTEVPLSNQVQVRGCRLMERGKMCHYNLFQYSCMLRSHSQATMTLGNETRVIAFQCIR